MSRSCEVEGLNQAGHCLEVEGKGAWRRSVGGAKKEVWGEEGRRGEWRNRME